MYRAKRVSLSEIELYDPAGALLARSILPNIIWRTEEAPISDALTSKLQSRPEIDVGGRKYLVHRRLASNNWLVNDFALSLCDGNGADVATADMKAGKWTHVIVFAGKNYTLVRHGFFRFDFELEESGRRIARFRDVTPFLTFNVRRDFVIEGDASIDPVLLSLSVFIAISWFFK